MYFDLERGKKSRNKKLKEFLKPLALCAGDFMLLITHTLFLLVLNMAIMIV